MRKPKGLAILVGLSLLVGVGAYVQQTLAEDGLQTLTAADHVEIRNLYATYNHYVDSGKDNGYAYADLWTEDAVFHINLGNPRVVNGREELAEVAQGAGSPPPVLKAAHHAVNIMIEPTPEGAHGRAYLVMVSSPTEGTSTTGLSAIYEDDLVKTADGWKFKMRTVEAVTPQNQG